MRCIPAHELYRSIGPWAKNGDLWNVVWTMLPPIVERTLSAGDQVWMQVRMPREVKCYRLGPFCTALCSCRCETYIP